MKIINENCQIAKSTTPYKKWIFEHDLYIISTDYIYRIKTIRRKVMADGSVLISLQLSNDVKALKRDDTKYIKWISLNKGQPKTDDVIEAFKIKEWFNLISFTGEEIIKVKTLNIINGDVLSIEGDICEEKIPEVVNEDRAKFNKYLDLLKKMESIHLEAKKLKRELD